MELLSPAGSITHALEAIKNGADAVYFGLQNFSARKSAVNFSFDEARILKQKCVQENVRLYCALNTIVHEEELDELAAALKFLDYLECDGIIVQDFAVASLVKKLGLNLPLHASTQMAVHSPDGAAFLKKNGFSRVIPARELTVQEIGQIHADNPELELEVFIHGAMCYSMSGNCFASSYITGRSGNRGECAQICRTWFEKNNGRGYYFSAADLARKETILELEHAGVSALKIEGRMKSPAYAALATAFYRTILDERDARKPDQELENRLKTEFSRNSWPGFSEKDIKGRIDPEYPGHRGLKAGRVLSWENGLATLEPSIPLQQRDGVLLFASDGELRKPVRLSWPAIPGQAEKSVKIPVSEQVSGDFYKISTHDSAVRQRNRFASAEFWQKQVNIEAEIFDNTIRLTIPGLFAREYTIQSEKSTSEDTFEEKFRTLFKKSGESYCRSGKLTVQYKNGSGSSLFIRPSELKKIKNDLFARLDTHYRTPVRRKAERIRDREIPVSTLPERQKMNPKRSLPLPFVSDFSLTHNGMDSELPAQWQDFRIYPLRPVNFGEADYKYKLKEAVGESLNHGKKLLIGLNNPAHLLWAPELTAEFGTENISFFIDYALCCANSASLAFFREHIPSLAAVLPWIEAADNSRTFPTADTELIRTGKDFTAPYFTSRHCFFSNYYGCSNCNGRKTEIIRQNGREYMVISEQCVNYLVPAPGKR